ncbi:hypothetical protein CO615_04125 [Lysobacteraceae bacterium NML75-0749]|nr:hypothetical protein CO615_04125 [Xanthomonadaceae bacterium NML75-0749]
MSKQSGKRMCKICRQRRELKFVTGNMAVCRHCITLLNRIPVSPQQATLNLKTRCITEHQSALRQKLANASDEEKEQLRQRLADINSEADSVFPAWLNAKLLDKKDRARELKVIRAYRRGMITWKPGFISMPDDWFDIADEIKKRDNWMCGLCGQQEAPQFIRVHHIVQPSNSGTNKPANLVSLCFKCFKSQHSNSIPEEHEIFGQKNLTDRPERISSPPQVAPSQALASENPHTVKPNHKPLLIAAMTILVSVLLIILMDRIAG